MTEEKKVGLKIEIKDEVQSSRSPFYAKASFYTKASPMPIGVEGAILLCLSQQTTIEVVATSLEDAIERILFSLGSRPAERRFLLWQISKNLKEVSDFTKNRSYTVDGNIKNLIAEDKLYRIQISEDLLFKDYEKSDKENVFKRAEEALENSKPVDFPRRAFNKYLEEKIEAEKGRCSCQMRK